MKLSFIAVVLASLSAVAFAQIRTSMELGETNYLEADDPVYMNKRGEIVPASNVARSDHKSNGVRYQGEIIGSGIRVFPILF